MPGLQSFLTVALSLLAISARAVAVDSADASLAERDSILGAEVFSNGFEKRAGNWHGKKCTANSNCKTDVLWARPSCNKWGKCTFKCVGGTVQKGNTCVPRQKNAQCKKDRDCKTSVKHASAVCWKGKCEIKCDRWYHLESGKCVRNNSKCSTKNCYSVENGYSSCEHGKCSYHCATYLGYTLFTNARKTAYRCINLNNDPQNCGRVGKHCHHDYMGKGYPYCDWGKCKLSCSGYKSTKTLNGHPYCSDA